MGPGGLILASAMSGKVSFSEGMRVMDLGCGKGGTSMFLAQTYGVVVYAIDLWISANELFKNVQAAGCENTVLPFNLDATRELPFPDQYFDVIFCMDAWHYFGAKPGFVAYIGKYLKRGGHLVIGNPCFDREFEAEVPKVYQAFWADEFSNYHSPKWWEALIQRTNLFTSIAAEQLRDGVVLWEDALLHDVETGNTKGGRLEADADEIVFGQDNPQYPHLTHYILTCTKK